MVQLGVAVVFLPPRIHSLGRWALGAAASGYLVLQAQQRAHCGGVAHRVAPPVIIEVHENIPLLRLPFP